MFEQARLYYVYNLWFIRFFRLLFLAFLLFVSIVTFVQDQEYNARLFAPPPQLQGMPNAGEFASLFCFGCRPQTNWVFPTAVLYVFLLWELFFYFKLSRYQPQRKISENASTDIFASFTLDALAIYKVSHSGSTLAKRLVHKPQIVFFLERMGAVAKEVQYSTSFKEEIASTAFHTVQKVNGIYVTTMDLFAAYLLLTEEQTKFLFHHHLKKEEFLQILQWTREVYKKEEEIKPRRVTFWGEGIGEGLVTGWTPETKNFTKNLTTLALAEHAYAIGREDIYRQFVEELSKKENNNVMLVGERGVGKDNLVKLLAQRLFFDTNGNLVHYRIFELMVGQLIAGASDRGTLESRLQAIIEEISHAIDVILYIPEFQNILGSTSYSIDLSGALLPYLHDGKIPVIATMTLGLYKQFLQENPLKEVFSVLVIPEPEKDVAIRMVEQKMIEREKKELVRVTYKAVVASVSYANRYVQDSFLPGNAITLLDDVIASVHAAKDIPFVKGKKNITEQLVFKEIEERTHIAVTKPEGQEIEVLLHLEEKLHNRVVAQNEAVSTIAEAMRRVRSGLTLQTKPISFLFLGPTGVGKTETAKALAALYFGGEDKMIRLDMSEYSGEEGMKRLLGANPGEGNERGELTEKVHDHPFALLLLDEFEKADVKILDLFLQILDDGRLTDNKGRTVSFGNTIIIATSNAGSEFIRQSVTKGIAVDKAFHQQLLEYLQTNHIFKPELLNRFDAVVTYKPLGQKDVGLIVQRLLANVKKKLDAQDVTVTFDTTVVEKIAKEGFDPQFGARPLLRFIQDTIEDELAKKLLNNEITRGSSVRFTVDTNGVIIASLV